MEVTGVKFICEHKNGDISTWHDVLNTRIDEVIRKVMHNKNWIGGRFLEIYIEFDINGKYYKTYLDIDNGKFNQLLGT
jgi:hypothetical protein